MKNIINKQLGYAMSTELLLILVVLNLGAIVAFTTMRDSNMAEMEDLSEAIGSMDQTYEHSGITNPQTTALIEGSSFGDEDDNVFIPFLGVSTAGIDDLVFRFTDPGGAAGVPAEGTLFTPGAPGAASDATGNVTP